MMKVGDILVYRTPRGGSWWLLVYASQHRWIWMCADGRFVRDQPFNEDRFKKGYSIA